MFNRRCVPMDMSLLSAWGADDRHFYCRRCAFQNDVYDADFALSRLVILPVNWVYCIRRHLNIGMVRHIYMLATYLPSRNYNFLYNLFDPSIPSNNFIELLYNICAPFRSRDWVDSQHAINSNIPHPLPFMTTSRASHSPLIVARCT